MARKNVAAILHDHLTFEMEAIDRIYLYAYVPSLQDVLASLSTATSSP